MKQINYKLVYIDSGQYGTYRVIDMDYDGRPARMLYGEDSSPQSGMAKDDNPELLFDYNQRFLEIMMSRPPRRALVIGGGVLMLPIAAWKLFPELTIDTVEIDKLQIQLARDYFDLPSDPRLNVYIADGLDFAKSTKATYDMIMVDAFNGYKVPAHLVDAAAAHQYKKSLAKNGIVAVNFISEYKPGQPSAAHDIIDSFSRSFKYIDVYQSDPSDEPGIDQNMVLVASNTELSLDYLQSINVIK